MAPAGMECPKCGLSNPPGLLACPRCATPFDFDPNATMAGDFSGGPSSPASQETDFAATQWSGPESRRAGGHPLRPAAAGRGAGGPLRDSPMLGKAAWARSTRPGTANWTATGRAESHPPGTGQQSGHHRTLQAGADPGPPGHAPERDSMFDLGTAGGIKFITMEFIEGQVP